MDRSPMGGRRPTPVLPPTREGTPGRHEPPLCRHEPPRFARQTEPQLSINENDKTSTCAYVVREVFFNLCFKFKQKIFFTNFSI